MTKRPFVTIKIAQTFDGKIAATGGRSRWITGPAARRFVHQLRAGHDAILVGKNTFQKDKPRLASVKTENPCWKVVLTSPDLLPIKNAGIFEGNAQVVFVVERKDLKKWIKNPALQKRQCLFLVVKKKADGYDLNELLKKLSALGVKKLLVEGGGEVFWSFLNRRFADKIYWFMAPKIFGGRTATTSVEGKGFLDPNRALNLKIKRVLKLGKDFCFEATFLENKNLKKMSSPRRRGPRK